MEMEEVIPGKLKFDRMMKGYPKAVFYIELSDSNELSKMSFKLVAGIFGKKELATIRCQNIRPFLPKKILDVLPAEFYTATNIVNLGQKLAYALNRKVVFIWRSDQQENAEPCFFPDLKWWEQWQRLLP